MNSGVFATGVDLVVDPTTIMYDHGLSNPRVLPSRLVPGEEVSRFDGPGVGSDMVDEVLWSKGEINASEVWRTQHN